MLRKSLHDEIFSSRMCLSHWSDINQILEPCGAHSLCTPSLDITSGRVCFHTLILPQAGHFCERFHRFHGSTLLQTDLVFHIVTNIRVYSCRVCFGLWFVFTPCLVFLSVVSHVIPFPVTWPSCAAASWLLCSAGVVLKRRCTDWSDTIEVSWETWIALVMLWCQTLIHLHSTASDWSMFISSCYLWLF